MFEDIEILHLDAPIITMFALAIVNLGLLVWLKHGFPREWTTWLLQSDPTPLKIHFP